MPLSIRVLRSRSDAVLRTACGHRSAPVEIDDKNVEYLRLSGHEKIGDSYSRSGSSHDNMLHQDF